VMVQSGVYEEFLSRVREAMAKLVIGDGLKPGVTIGPLINQSQLEKVSRWVQEAVSSGATLEMGGSPHGGLFYPPTLLTGMTQGMPCIREEVFGPVVAVAKFETEEEAIAMANDCSSGLAGYVCSSDNAQVWRLSARVEVGMLGINEGAISCAESAFGGIKESGMGREGSVHGMHDYQYIKYLCIGALDK